MRRSTSTDTLSDNLEDQKEALLPISVSDQMDKQKTSVSSSKPQKLAHFDGLRGVAALWVFFIHFLPGTHHDAYKVCFDFFFSPPAANESLFELVLARVSRMESQCAYILYS